MDQAQQDIWKKIHRIEIKTNRLVNSLLGGQYSSAFKGTGLEFDEVRAYQEGDDERHIDWNVTARTGEMHVKRFVEERELSIVLLVDTSPSMYFGSQFQLKTDIVTEFCALMAFSAMRNSDRVGFLSFDHKVSSFLSPKKGRRHCLHLLRNLIYTHQNIPVENKGGSDLNQALNHLSHILDRRAIVFIVSDFIGTGDLFPLKVLSRRHDCIAVRLSDPLEKQLPNIGLIQISDPETGQVLTQNFNSKLARAYRAKAKAFSASFKHSLNLMGVELIELSTASDSVARDLLQFYRFHHVH